MLRTVSQMMLLISNGPALFVPPLDSNFVKIGKGDIVNICKPELDDQLFRIKSVEEEHLDLPFGNQVRYHVCGIAKLHQYQKGRLLEPKDDKEPIKKLCNDLTIDKSPYILYTEH